MLRLKVVYKPLEERTDIKLHFNTTSTLFRTPLRLFSFAVFVIAIQILMLLARRSPPPR